MIWALRWSVALRTFYRQILSLLYSSFPFGNFRPRLVRALLVDTNLPFVVSSQVLTRQNTQKHTWVGGPVGSLSRGTLKLQDIKILTRLSTVLSSKLCWLRHLRTSLQLGSKPASFCMFMVWAPVSRLLLNLCSWLDLRACLDGEELS